MKKNNYNIDDEQFKEVIESLKQLPQVNAPVNFEMNLRRKLNNLQNQKKEKKGFFYYFNLKRPLIPAAAAVVCAIVVFIFISRQPEVEKPFMQTPSPSTQVQNEANKSLQRKSIQKDPANITSSDVTTRKGSSRNKQPSTKHETVNPQSIREADQIASGERGVRRLRDLDFGGFGSNLDKSLRAKPDPNGGEEYGNPGSNVNFGGFNLVPGPDREMDLLRARMDSLKRIWLRGDR